MEYKDNLQELMTDIVSIFGKQVITDKKFVNLIADYRGFEKNRAAKRILSAIVANKYSGLIADLGTTEFDFYKLKYFAHELSKTHGFEEDIVETIMRMLLFACNSLKESDKDFSIEKREDKFGCVDSNGNILIPFEYDRIKDFESDYGTHLVCIKRFLQGDVYSTSGDLLFSGDDRFILTNEKWLWIVKRGNKVGAIHPNGEIVVPFEYKRIITVNPQSDVKILIIETDSGFGVIDYKGRQILPPVFESICNFVDETFGIIETKLADRYMYFNIDGSVAEITPLFCTTPFSESTYNTNDHKMPKGFIVNGQRLVISTTHNDITDLSGKIICSLDKFNDGLAVAKNDPWIGYMNASLEFIIREIKFADSARFDLCQPFNNGYAVVWKGNKRGLINTKGEIVVGIQYANIIRRNWGFILRYSESAVQTCFNGDEYLVGDCYLKPYEKYSSFKCTVNGIFDIGDFVNDRTFAQYRNFVGIVTSEGKSIEPIEYEWFRTWNSPKLEDAKIISPVRRNGVWGTLDLEHGFEAFSEDVQERNESRYITKLKEKGYPVPYFYEYQRTDNLCGFKWNNLFHIPIDLYDSFIQAETSMTIDARKQWLNSNSVTILR